MPLSVSIQYGCICFGAHPYFLAQVFLCSVGIIQAPDVKGRT